jgi:hypothetical protein
LYLGDRSLYLRDTFSYPEGRLSYPKHRISDNSAGSLYVRDGKSYVQHGMSYAGDSRLNLPDRGLHAAETKLFLRDALFKQWDSGGNELGRIVHN